MNLTHLLEQLPVLVLIRFVFYLLLLVMKLGVRRRTEFIAQQQPSTESISCRVAGDFLQVARALFASRTFTDLTTELVKEEVDSCCCVWTPCKWFKDGLDLLSLLAAWVLADNVSLFFSYRLHLPFECLELVVKLLFAPLFLSAAGLVELVKIELLETLKCLTNVVELFAAQHAEQNEVVLG